MHLRDTQNQKGVRTPEGAELQLRQPLQPRINLIRLSITRSQQKLRPRNINLTPGSRRTQVGLLSSTLILSRFQPPSMEAQNPISWLVSATYRGELKGNFSPSPTTGVKRAKRSISTPTGKYASPLECWDHRRRMKRIIGKSIGTIGNAFTSSREL